MKNIYDNIGLYVHIPFCVRKCSYCDFNSVGIGAGDDELVERMVSSLINELYSVLCGVRDAVKNVSRKTYMCNTISTVFIGGGTPSVVPCGYMEKILSAIRDAVNRVNNSHGGGLATHSDIEFTVECNPGTVGKDKLRLYRDYGVNRLSIGLQSTIDDELISLGRIHDYDDFIRTYELARSMGFDNINVDLMSAIPHQSVDSYRTSLERVIKLHPEHISTYSLIIEEGTPFYDRYKDNPPTDEDDDSRMYMLADKLLSEAGYMHYEVSNYAGLKQPTEALIENRDPVYEGALITDKDIIKRLDGYNVCKHNLNYWRRGGYIGIGPSAASFISTGTDDNGIRRVNTSDIHSYMESVMSGVSPTAEEEALSHEQALIERIYLGLRMSEGVDVCVFDGVYDDKLDKLHDIFDRYASQGLLMISDDRLKLSAKGMWLSDMIISDILGCM